MLKLAIFIRLFLGTFALALPMDANSSSPSNAEVIAKLKQDATHLDQYHDILTDGQNLLAGKQLKDATIFDFKNDFPVPGERAHVGNFPILIDSGITFSVASLGPCGVFFPHVHPRANELFTVIEGELSFKYQVESSALPLDPAASMAIAPVSGNLTKFTGTLFPQGSIHYQINHSCEPATIVATLSSEDAGTTAILQQPGGGSMMSKGKRQADIGDIEQYYSTLPADIVDAAKQCVARCRI
ncbi:hypothetical protein Q7P37_000789 [Cladosporium fusiforme]